MNDGSHVQVIMINGDRIWPARITKYDMDQPTVNLSQIQDWLLKDGKVCIEQQITATDRMKTICSVHEIRSIQGPITDPTEPIDQVLTTSEAAELWGYGDGSTIRKAIASGRMIEHQDFRKSAGNNLITRKAMQRIFNAIPKNEIVPLLEIKKIKKYESNGENEIKIDNSFYKVILH